MIDRYVDLLVRVAADLAEEHPDEVRPVQPRPACWPPSAASTS